MTVADEPVVPAPPPPDPEHILTPEQLAGAKVRIERAVAVARELVTILRLVEEHDYVKLLGELHAVFSELAAPPRS